MTDLPASGTIFVRQVARTRPLRRSDTSTYEWLVRFVDGPRGYGRGRCQRTEDHAGFCPTATRTP